MRKSPPCDLLTARRFCATIPFLSPEKREFMVARHGALTHLDISADVTVETTAVADPALSPSSATDKALAVSGTISQARTGIGLPGVQVVALAGLGSERMQEVGRSESDVTGRFSM